MPGYSALWPTAETVGDLARRQHEVVARPQLHALGVTRGHLRHEVRARRWRLAGQRAVILHRGEPTPVQRIWVALLNAGPRAAAGGLTAAALDGLAGSRRPPRTRLDRSLVDAATWATDPVFACGLLAAAVQQRLTTPGRLRVELATRRAGRHRRLLLAVLGDIEGGAQSFAEIDAGRLGRRAGLPAPTRQAVAVDPLGRRRYLDLYWDPPGLCVEIDGAFHLREEDWRLDMDRQNDLVADGRRVLRFPTITVRATPDRFLDQVARALAAPPGW